MPAIMNSPARAGRISHRSTVTRDPSELSAFLPSSDDPDYLWVLSELICDDLAQQWSDGNPRYAQEYRDTFPELFNNTAALQPVLEQEVQLRKAAGEKPDLIEYRKQFGVDLPGVIDVTVQTPGPKQVIDRTVVHSIVPFPVEQNIQTAAKAPAVDSNESEFDRVAPELFPKAGDVFEGFLLKEMLGRGAFAHVYLAEQVGLSNREVAIKVTKRLGKEAGRLARLQHANIVPIFSFHAGKEWQAICMPFFGRQTLEDIIKEVRKARRMPTSGGEIFSTVAIKGQSTVKSATPKTDSTTSDTFLPSDASSRGELRNVLTNLSYPDAAVLLVAQIADGLAHAHSMGIWHLDLKPANVLVSEHGQPMLLDFNLAFDSVRENRERFGGTIPYMAPEQLEEMIESRDRYAKGLAPVEPRISKVDSRTDLFSVGVMLYELLTGRHPFPTQDIPGDPFLAAHKARLAARPTARQLNSNVSAGVDAIVERLLAIKKQDRYSSAMQLRQDLMNHLEHKPLAFVREPSLFERFAKWRKRNPKALVRTAAAAAFIAASGATTWGARQWEKVNSTAARDQAAAFESELPSLRMDLAAPLESASFHRGLERAKLTFEKYGIAENTPLITNAFLNRLSADQRKHVLCELGEVAALASFAEKNASFSTTGESRAAADSRAKQWNQIALSCFNGLPTPISLGGEENDIRSQFLDATIALREGRSVDAMKMFEDIVKVEPQHAAAQFLYAFALMDQYQLTRAMERFEVAGALVPNDFRPAYNCGLLLAHKDKWAAAEAAFSDAIARNPSYVESWVYRSQQRFKLRKSAEALADCNTAIDKGGITVRTLALRAQIYEQMNNKAAAKRDLEAINATKPEIATDFFARGMIRDTARDYTGALADFKAAATLFPRFFEAWNNQAFVLSERLHETDMAIDAMNKAIESNQQSGELLLVRAVLLARVGKREAAIADVEKGLLLTTDPKSTYRAACVFALTSKTTPKDADQAVVYLRQAVSNGFRQLHIYKSDTDIDPIRNRDDVKNILNAVKTIVN